MKVHLSFIALFLFSWLADIGQARSSCKGRVDCHPTPGANQQNCEAKGCFWSPCSTAGCPWCIYPPSCDKNRLDCFPEPGATQQKCQQKGCAWSQCSSTHVPWCYYVPPCEPIKVDCLPDTKLNQALCGQRGCRYETSSVQNEPWCYFDPQKMAGYDASGVTKSSTGITGQLTRRSSPTILGNDYQNVQLKVAYESDQQLRITLDTGVSNSAIKNWEATLPKTNAQGRSSSALYTVAVENSPFGIAVTRVSTGTVIFDTRNIAGLTMASQFLSITTRTPTARIYGFGEQTHQTLQRDMFWQKLRAFSLDQPVGINGPYYNLYGVHPFYLGIENDGSAHGVVLINSNAQMVELAPYPSITYRTIGGNLDFRLFLGPTPASVIQQYGKTIGLPAMPPYWSLGFHLCRYGYHNLNNVRTVLERNLKARIPQDTQWIDIDYMDYRRDFTINHTDFAGLPSFVNYLHSINKKFVPILDPCIYDKDPNYSAYTTGIAQNIFIKNPKTGQPLEGQVWPGTCVFPDYCNPKSVPWWQNQIQIWNKKVPSDGLWIDMNEPSNAFNDGSTSGCNNNQWNNPPYFPMAYSNIYHKTICMDSMQTWGRHYDAHSMYGYCEAVATNKALKALFPGKRPFILSRSTYPGSGHWTAHWTGDNGASFVQMQWSINTILEFQLFGIPFIGADMCGFLGNSWEELCTRWMQLGAFYPFSRNHNTIGATPQDPAHWSAKSIQSSRKALQTRYKLLPFLYTLLHNAHTTGAPVVNALAYLWPADGTTWSIKDQFLWGQSLMIVPVLNQGQRSRDAYFPAGRWFSYYTNTGQEVPSPALGRWQTLSIDEWSIGVYVRGGSIIPWQTPAITTVDSRKNSMGILVALDGNAAATGSLFWDDGETLDTDKNGQCLSLSFTAVKHNSRSSGTLEIQRTANGYRGSDGLNFAEIQIFGFGPNRPLRVTVNGNRVSAGNINYESDLQALVLTGLSIPVSSASSNIQTVEWFFS